jgi:F-type H+-transporting ATPase subunit epsilon
MSFLLEIISPTGKIFKGEVKKVSVPAATGTLTILSHHVPLFTPLNEGKIKITTLQDKSQIFDLGKGLMEVKKDKVSLLIESSEYVEEQLKKKTEAAEKMVEEIKKENQPSASWRSGKKELLTPKQEVRRSLVDLKKIKKRKKIPLLSENQT